VLVAQLDARSQVLDAQEELAANPSRFCGSTLQLAADLVADNGEVLQRRLAEDRHLVGPARSSM